MQPAYYVTCIMQITPAAQKRTTMLFSPECFLILKIVLMHCGQRIFSSISTCKYGGMKEGRLSHQTFNLFAL